MDQNHVVAIVKAMRAYIHLLIVLVKVANWLIDYEERRTRRRTLRQRTFSVLQSRSIEIQRITQESDIICINELRMDRNAFAILFELLKTHGLLDDGNVTIEEQVATFVNILAHHTKNRCLQVRFYRSGETISRYVNRVLRALLRLQEMLFAKPTPVEDDCPDRRWKWFKGCLGAIDGTYIEATVPESDKPRYRTRKGHIAINFLGACNRDMNFVYVLSGWEGSATDSRVLQDAVIRNNGFRVPLGNYYLADAGYVNGNGFLAPYRGTRYHLREWEHVGHTPTNKEEYFNMKHSQARNIIERCFGILKKRWAILHSPSFYPIKLQGQMIIACALLHSFIRMYMSIDPEENTTLNDMPFGEDLSEADDNIETVEVVESSNEWTQWRDDIAQEMSESWMSSRI